MARTTDTDRKLSDDNIRALKVLVDHALREDETVRQSMVLIWKKYKLYWESFQRLYYSSVARDWRVATTSGDRDSAHYDKTVNIYSAYLESIIAALSITVPNIRCVPDDAENNLDISTARAGDTIARLISKHNDAPLLWIHALFVLLTEGMVAAYRHKDYNDSYGTYNEKIYKTEQVDVETKHCPTCNAEISNETGDDTAYCPRCMMDVDEPISQIETTEQEVFDKEVSKPKCRQIIEAFGGLNVKIPIYARNQESCPYLVYSYELHWAVAEERYNIGVGGGSSRGQDYWDRWGRTSPQYGDDEPDNNVTCHHVWIRPALYNVLNGDQHLVKWLKKTFPKGVKITQIDDWFAEAEEAELDNDWTLTYNPNADFLYFEPLAAKLVSVQDVTNDLINLVLQTMEHGIGQMFVDPAVVNFQAYEKMSIAPGSMIPAIPKGGKSLSESFFESRTSNQAKELEPIFQQFQQLGQLASGALPSLFGGPAPGSSRTAAEYSMSRAQALQRLQTHWKMLLVWWEKIFTKAIPAFMRDMIEDERLVSRNELGVWFNQYIRKADTQGKIGGYQIEGSEQLPITMAQKKDSINEMVQTQNPAILQALTATENIPLLTEALGLPEFKLPNQMDMEKQFDEIQTLINTEPIAGPNGQEMPSVEVDQELDAHAVEAETCRRWLISPVGRQYKTTNAAAYRNVLLHFKNHQQLIPPPPEVQAEMDKARAKDAPPNINLPGGPEGSPPNGTGAPPQRGPVEMEPGSDYGPATDIDTIQ